MRKLMEEMFDMFLFLGGIIGALLFFLGYWRGEYQTRCAELVLEEFLEGAAEDGRLSLEEYEIVVQQLNRINSDYELKLYYVGSETVPCYALIPKTELDEYYLGRNIRKHIALEEDIVVAEEENPEELCLQTESNASIMAAENLEYLPLPDDEAVISVEAVRRQQTVYEGESLITLCLVSSEEGHYYVEAEPICAYQSGIVELEVYVGEEWLKTEVEVVCYPRVKVCEYGHEFTNSRSFLAEPEEREKWEYCPYCRLLPQKVECNREILFRMTGDTLTSGELWLEVTFFDGHTEQITPDSEEWQDDYDRNYCGLQLVTLQYRGQQDYITVIAENEACENCLGSCNGRYYPDYTAFPYCTECMSKEELFTGEVREEMILKDTGELVAVLDREGIFLFPKGDVLVAELLERGKTVTVLQERSKRSRKEENG